MGGSAKGGEGGGSAIGGAKSMEDAGRIAQDRGDKLPKNLGKDKGNDAQSPIIILQPIFRNKDGKMEFEPPTDPNRPYVQMGRAPRGVGDVSKGNRKSLLYDDWEGTYL